MAHRLRVFDETAGARMLTARAMLDADFKLLATHILDDPPVYVSVWEEPQRPIDPAARERALDDYTQDNEVEDT